MVEAHGIEFQPLHGVAHGGDIAFLYGVIRTLIKRGWIDENFIATHTAGFAELR